MSTDHPIDTKTVSPASPSTANTAGKAERLKAYRKAYWQTFKRDHVRVYGTLTKTEHAEIKRVAERNGRSVDWPARPGLVPHHAACWVNFGQPKRRVWA